MAKAAIVLRGINGPIRGTIWESSDLLRVGRLDGMEVLLDDSSVSRSHAEIRWTEQGWVVLDLESTNGTRFNGVRIGNGPWPLRVKDQLQFGEMAVEVEAAYRPTGVEWFATATTPEERAFALDETAISDRKLILFASACCRSDSQAVPVQVFGVARVVKQVAVSRFVGVAQRHESGLASLEDVRMARRRFERFNRLLGTENVAYPVDGWTALEHQRLGRNHQVFLNSLVCMPPGCGGSRYWRDEYAQILLEMIGPPTAVTLDPSWLGWNDGLIRKMTQSIHDARSFDDMPILGDALEDCGCAEEAILRHCREPGRHYRGCWVLDLLTGRE